MENLTNSKKFLLEESKVFCMLPWEHMHFWPNGSALPCCLANSDIRIGEYGDKNLKELWNAELMKELRLNMLSEKKSESCKRCYRLEELGLGTLRQSSNRLLEKYFADVDKTMEDGSVEDIHFRHLDVRFSNLCNFSCRTCGPNLSSGWYEDQLKIDVNHSNPKVIRISPHEKFQEELYPFLSEVDQAYFAGGEPFITDELFQILDHWIKMDRRDLYLSFTTNFSYLQYQKFNILDYLSKFKNVRISASLDDSGERAELLRKGTNWLLIESNRRLLLEKCPHIIFEITPTISVFNVFHFPEFHLDWSQKKLIDPCDLRLNLLTEPEFMSFAVIQPVVKKKLINKWNATLAELCSISRQNGKTESEIKLLCDSYQSVIKAIESTQHSWDQCVQFIHRMMKMDEIRNESTTMVFPELHEILLAGWQKSLGPTLYHVHNLYTLMSEERPITLKKIKKYKRKLQLIALKNKIKNVLRLN